MASKQRSIFDKEPVKVQPRKDQKKTEDAFVPFEESIFALNKKSKVAVSSESVISKEEYVPIEDSIFCTKNICHEESESVHDDEVPFEESIFAKPEKEVSIESKVFLKKNKIDLDELFNKYKDIYAIGYISSIKRLNIIDANMYNICCMNLEKSRETKIMNTEAYDIVKKVIKSKCTCIEDIFYSYINMNTALIHLISEVNPDTDIDTIYHILDRSYDELINEFGGKVWQK